MRKEREAYSEYGVWDIGLFRHIRDEGRAEAGADASHICSCIIYQDLPSAQVDSDHWQQLEVIAVDQLGQCSRWVNSKARGSSESGNGGPRRISGLGVGRPSTAPQTFTCPPRVDTQGTKPGIPACTVTPPPRPRRWLPQTRSIASCS